MPHHYSTEPNLEKGTEDRLQLETWQPSTSSFDSHTSFNSRIDDIASDGQGTGASSSPVKKPRANQTNSSNRAGSGSASLSRTISEVRDGIETRHDIEVGEAGISSGVEQTETERDPNVVAWNKPSDPENPKEWSTKRKWAAVFCGMFLLDC